MTSELISASCFVREFTLVRRGGHSLGSRDEGTDESGNTISSIGALPVVRWSAIAVSRVRGGRLFRSTATVAQAGPCLHIKQSFCVKEDKMTRHAEGMSMPVTFRLSTEGCFARNLPLDTYSPRSALVHNFADAIVGSPGPLTGPSRSHPQGARTIGEHIPISSWEQKYE